jgi:NAD-dependent deacetylase
VVRVADRLFEQADLVLVIGSSLEVSPASRMPLLALDRGAHLIIVNRGGTYLDERAAAVFHEDLAVVLPQLIDEVLHG